MTLAIDISSNNGVFDLASFKRNHPDLVAVVIKATESAGYVNPDMAAMLKQCGPASVVSLPYHFAQPASHPGLAGGALEAVYFLHEIEGKGFTGRPVLDYETAPNESYITGWISTVRKAGLEPIVYVSGSRVPEVTAVAPHIDLWVAAYGVSSYTQYTHAHPGRVVMWQYSDNLEGFDASHVYVSADELRHSTVAAEPKQVYEEVWKGGKVVDRTKVGDGRVPKLLGSKLFAKIVSKGKDVTVRRRAH